MLYSYRISNVCLKNKNGKWLKMIYVYYITCARIFFSEKIIKNGIRLISQNLLLIIIIKYYIIKFDQTFF